MRVEDANIYEGSLVSPTPKPVGGNINSGTVLHIGRGVSELLPCEGLEVGLKLDIIVIRDAVKSRISLWRILGKPPLGQERECSM